jgi:hypothetical protein
MIEKLIQFHDDPNSTLELMASRLGCDPDKARMALEPLAPNELHVSDEQ